LFARRTWSTLSSTNGNKGQNEPRGNQTGYSLFSAKERARIISDYPNLANKPKEIFSKIGEEWKNTTEDTKAKYNAEAKSERERYKATQEPKKEELKGPNRNANGYSIFVLKNRTRIAAENPNIKPTEIFTKIAEAWKNTPQKTKEEYNGLALIERDKYKSIQVILPKGKEEKGKKGKKEKGKKGKKEGKKEKGNGFPLNSVPTSKPLTKPRSAYILFSLAERPEIVKKYSNLSPREIMSKLGEAWKNVPLDIEQKYKLAAQIEKDAFGKLNSKVINTD